MRPDDFWEAFVSGIFLGGPVYLVVIVAVIRLLDFKDWLKKSHRRRKAARGQARENARDDKNIHDLTFEMARLKVDRPEDIAEQLVWKGWSRK